MNDLLRALLVALTSVAFLAAQEPTVQEQLEEMRERIDELEEMQAETAESVEGRALVKAFSADSLDFGGHVTSLFSHIDGEASSATGHQVTLIELFVKAQIDDQWSVFAAPGIYSFNGGLLDNPATPTVAGDPLFTADNSTVENLLIARAYGQWHHSDSFQVQGGIVGSPHGTTNRQYFIPARAIAQASLHTRLFLGNQLYPQVLRGARVMGKWTVGDNDWLEYDAYFGAEAESAADGIGGGRLAYTFGELGMTVAANYGRGTRDATTTPTTNFGVLQSPFAGTPFLTRDYQFGGIDVDWRKGDFMFKGEAYYSAEDGVRDQRALSLETTWFASAEWGVSYRYDFYDAGADLNPFLPTPAVLDLGHSTEHVIGVMFNPNSSVRLRLDLHHNNLPSTSDTVQYANLSWSISF